MVLADYEGHTPTSEPHLPVQHATHHRRWSPERTARDACEACGATFDVRDRHVLERVDAAPPDDDSSAAERRYVCRERCVAAWVGDRKGAADANADENAVAEADEARVEDATPSAVSRR